MWRCTAFFSLALLTACAGVRTGKPVSVPGQPPRNVMIELLSGFEYKPYSPEELANPTIQSIIAQCERQGGKRCRENKEPGSPLTKFVRTKNDKVIALVKLGGLEPGRDYEVRCQWFDPQSNMRKRNTYTTYVPLGFQPDWTLSYWFNYTPVDPSALPEGRWRVEITVNEQLEGEHTFEVVE